MDDAVESRGMQASPVGARELEAELERFLALWSCGLTPCSISDWCERSSPVSLPWWSGVTARMACC
jgi:hypothetical protein